MVRASTFIVAAVAIAPVVLAAPLAVEEVSQDVAARSTIEDTVAELDARKFKFGKVFKGLKGIAKMAVNVAVPGAGAFIPREELDALMELDAREPEPEPFQAGSAHRANAHAGGAHPHPHAHAAHTGAHAPRTGTREHHLHAGGRHTETGKHHPGAHTKLGKNKNGVPSHGKFKGPKHSVNKGAKGAHNLKGLHGSKGIHKASSLKGPKTGKLNPHHPSAHAHARTHPREEDETALEVEARSFDDLSDDLEAREALFESTIADLIERGFLEIDEDASLEAREPKLRLGKFFSKVKQVAGKVTNVAEKVAGVGGVLGYREVEEEGEVEAREFGVDAAIDELD